MLSEDPVFQDRFSAALAEGRVGRSSEAVRTMMRKRCCARRVVEAVRAVDLPCRLSSRIVQRGRRIRTAILLKDLEASPSRNPQIVHFIGPTGVARRTGRFPQLVDPRSSVNGQLLTGSLRFRAVSLRAADAHPPCARDSRGLMPFRGLLRFESVSLSRDPLSRT